MPSIYSSALLLAAASAAIAAPTTKKAFTVPRIRTNHTNSAVAAHYHVFQKYRVAAPANVKAAADNGDETGSVSASAQQYDSEYICPVTVGSNQLQLDFDTGSSDL